ncbi:hypothetical protein OCH239_08640 [Roseivivax halodurans JCM 10272]|uniref:Ig-like domain-containing protein n=1 Tax=Roseivivax halodurans JCM 10272 TaxID=1449350 RepID=X7EK09_9RHOB|nr:hypothetical protein [Roseivivax halodurans]ETX16262.1 hypothetical protein OCH239_08640 [Roseivivax halodurans JCM 10272]
MKLAALFALPAVLALSACDMGRPGAAPQIAPDASGGAWSFATDPAIATLTGASPQVSVACRSNSAGTPVVVWTVDAPAADGAGETLTISAGTLRTAVALTGVPGPSGGYIWQGSVSPNDNSRQVFAASGPVSFTLASGARAVASEAGPVPQVYRGCN